MGPTGRKSGEPEPDWGMKSRPYPPQEVSCAASFVFADVTLSTPPKP